MSSLNLRPVERSDYGFLYELLEKRPTQYNITHKWIPLYEQHVDFLESQPYSEHYIVEEDGKRIGQLYIRDNQFVGIHTLDNDEEKVLQMLDKDKDYQFEVSPRNKHFQAILKRNGYRLLHETYA